MNKEKDKNWEDMILIKKILENGKKELYEHLILKYKQIIFNLCLRMTSNYSDSEDITQDVFLKVYSKLPDFKVKYNFGDWIYSIAINTIKDKLRRRKFSFFSLDKPIQTEEENILRETVDTSSSNPEYELLKKEELKQIYHLITSLPLKYRTIIVLRYIENFPYERICTVTGLSINTVKTRLHRAQKILYNKFEK